uniref:Uncharacterized protein n=1 Tax=viral metagenome TaxID=1070528 RepID=A0A6M3MFT2_9ZZZZ
MKLGDVLLYRRPYGVQVCRILSIEQTQIQIEVWRVISRDWHRPHLVSGSALDPDSDRLREEMDRLRAARCAPPDIGG